MIIPITTKLSRIVEENAVENSGIDDIIEILVDFPDEGIGVPEPNSAAIVHWFCYENLDENPPPLVGGMYQTSNCKCYSNRYRINDIPNKVCILRLYTI